MKKIHLKIPESLVLSIRPNSQNATVGKASTSTQRQVAIIAVVNSVVRQKREGGGPWTHFKRSSSLLLILGTNQRPNSWTKSRNESLGARKGTGGGGGGGKQPGVSFAVCTL